jgi:hypothetical protein
MVMKTPLNAKVLDSTLFLSHLISTHNFRDSADTGAGHRQIRDFLLSRYARAGR